MLATKIIKYFHLSYYLYLISIDEISVIDQYKVETAEEVNTCKYIQI